MRLERRPLSLACTTSTVHTLERAARVYAKDTLVLHQQLRRRKSKKESLGIVHACWDAFHPLADEPKQPQLCPVVNERPAATGDVVQTTSASFALRSTLDNIIKSDALLPSSPDAMGDGEPAASSCSNLRPTLDNMIDLDTLSSSSSRLAVDGSSTDSAEDWPCRPRALTRPRYSPALLSRLTDFHNVASIRMKQRCYSQPTPTTPYTYLHGNREDNTSAAVRDALLRTSATAMGCRAASLKPMVKPAYSSDEDDEPLQVPLRVTAGAGGFAMEQEDKPHDSHEHAVPADAALTSRDCSIAGRVCPAPELEAAFGRRLKCKQSNSRPDVPPHSASSAPGSRRLSRARASPVLIALPQPSGGAQVSSPQLLHRELPAATSQDRTPMPSSRRAQFIL